MRQLFILRGAPASGKSTWIRESGLEQYCISADQVRLMFQSPVLSNTGEYVISQDNDNKVWSLIYELIEERMKRGELVIVDATHYKSKLLNRYKDLCDTYRYRINVVDFTDVPLDVLLERNNSRDKFRKVPEATIRKMAACFVNDTEVRKSYNVLTPEQAKNLITAPLAPLDVTDKYNRIVVFGDIHGCYEPIKTYFEKNPFDNNTWYIFTGDYIDRGLQNKEVIEFLLTIYNKLNVLLLEGNHENWLRVYSSKEYRPAIKIDKYTSFDTTQINKNNNHLKQVCNKITKQIQQCIQDYCDVRYKLKEHKTEELVDQLKSLKEKHQQLTDEYAYANMLSSNVLKYATLIQETMSYSKDICTNYGEKYSLGSDMNVLKKYLDESIIKDLVKDEIKSSEFLNVTLPQIKEIPTKDIRMLCRKFAQLAYFNFRGITYLVTHGGVPCVPSLTTASNELIKGVGKYVDVKQVDEAFVNNETCISIHAHRNVFKDPCEQFDGRVYNLNTAVEYGEDLRVLTISDKITIDYIPNPVFNTNQKENTDFVASQVSPEQIIKQLEESKLVRVVELEDNIKSFNFTTRAFQDRKWNNLTCTARGLFVDCTNNEVAARSYSKFFNWGELDITKSANLFKTFKFPAHCFRKENGFLGLVARHRGKISYYSKSTNQGTFAQMFKTICEKYPNLESNIKDGYTYIFECIDPKNDPHIIKYTEPKVVLLDIVKNKFTDEYADYQDVRSVAQDMGCEYKQKEFTFNTWDELYTWRQKMKEDWSVRHEGWVIQDSNNFRVKMKSRFYTFWKSMRAVKQKIETGRKVDKIYSTEAEINTYKILTQHDKEELKNMSIIDIEDEFYTKYPDFN